MQQRERYVVTDVTDKTCKVQKFSGSQLRARTYTVNRANISVVPSWRFDDGHELSEDDDEGDRESTDAEQRPRSADVPPVNLDDGELEEVEPTDPCSSCQNLVTDEDDALSCDTCSKWCHAECGGVSQEAYQYLNEQAEEVRWMCPSCITVASDPRTVPHTAVLPAAV